MKHVAEYLELWMQGLKVYKVLYIPLQCNNSSLSLLYNW